MILSHLRILFPLAVIVVHLAAAALVGAQEAPHLETLPAPPAGEPSAPVPSVPGEEQPPRLERRRQKLADLPPFWRDTRIVLRPRLFLFHRENFDYSKRTALAGGGSLHYTSGYFLDRLAIGAVGYTANGLYCPRDRDGTGLLKPGQKNIHVLGQLYGTIKLMNQAEVWLFRKAYNTPYINVSDTRMIPNTFEAYTITVTRGDRRRDGWQGTVLGGYFTKIKYKDSSSFIPMSQAAGVRQDRGMALVSASVASEHISLEAANYYSPDIINIFYTEGVVRLEWPQGWSCRLAGQFSDQESVGANLLLKRPFSTRQLGVHGSIARQNGKATVAYTSNAVGGSNLQSRWGTYPGFTSVQVRDFNRAGEQALLLQYTHTFSRWGLDGMRVFVRGVRGWRRVNPTTRKPIPNETEIDVDIQWKPGAGFMKNLELRLRCARVWQGAGSNAALDDIRFIVNYHLPIL